MTLLDTLAQRAVWNSTRSQRAASAWSVAWNTLNWLDTCVYAEAARSLARDGTTVVARLVVDPTRVVIAHVGDSRA